MYVGNNPVNWLDPLGLSRDTYVPDPTKHGANRPGVGPHVDRYNPAGQNVGRYRPDGTPIPHKGRMPSPIPHSDKAKFLQAVKKLAKFGTIAGVLLDILLDPSEAGAASDCPYGPGTCGALPLLEPPAAPPESGGASPDCMSGRKGVC